MDLGIAGLRVMISAGAAGIGLAIARAFGREGARVHLCDVDDAALASLGGTDPDLGWTRCDVASRGDVARFFDEGLARLGGLDCLVNNAGIAGPTGTRRTDRPGRMGPLPGDRPDRPVQLRSARGAAAAAVDFRYRYDGRGVTRPWL